MKPTNINGDKIIKEEDNEVVVTETKRDRHGYQYFIQKREKQRLDTKVSQTHFNIKQGFQPKKSKQKQCQKCKKVIKYGERNYILEKDEQDNEIYCRQCFKLIKTVISL